MKKKIFVLFLMLSALSIGVSEDNGTENSVEKKSTGEAWREIGEQGKNALIETGKFFKSAGEEIGNQLLDAIKSVPPQKCEGTWIYKGKTVTTTLSCNDDGTMEISQKAGFEMYYWKGVYTSSLNAITFSVREKGRKTLAFKKAENVDENWLIFFWILDGGKKMKIVSAHIPNDKDGTSYSGIVLEKR